MNWISAVVVIMVALPYIFVFVCLWLSLKMLLSFQTSL